MPRQTIAGLLKQLGISTREYSPWYGYSKTFFDERGAFNALRERLPHLSEEEIYNIVDGRATVTGTFKKPVYKRLERKFEREITSDNGWLSPEGRFYECKYHMHSWLASMLWKDETHFWDEFELEEAGWVKCQSGYFFHTVSFSTTSRPRPTEIQKRMVRDRALENGEEVPRWAEES